MGLEKVWSLEVESEDDLSRKSDCLLLLSLKEAAEVEDARSEGLGGLGGFTGGLTATATGTATATARGTDEDSTSTAVLNAALEVLLSGGES